MIATTALPADPSALLLDVRAVGRLLGCSARHATRLADAGKLPRPIKLGRLIRWRRADIDAFIANGCKLESR